ncbi:MAG: hypothetical protein AAB564_00470 [Patescibacteria group bacterium]
MEEIYFWIKGNEIWSCAYEKFTQDGLDKRCKIFGSDRLVKKCASKKETKEELEKLVKENLKH